MGAGYYPEVIDWIAYSPTWNSSTPGGFAIIAWPACAIERQHSYRRFDFLLSNLNHHTPKPASAARQSPARDRPAGSVTWSVTSGSGKCKLQRPIHAFPARVRQRRSMRPPGLQNTKVSPGPPT